MTTVKEIIENNEVRPITLFVDGEEEICGLLSEDRVNRKEDLEGKYLYDIRHSDDDSGEPSTIEFMVSVNWFGTLIVDTPIESLENGSKEYLTITDFGYDD